MVGEKFSSLTKYIDTNWIFKLLASENLRKVTKSQEICYIKFLIFLKNSIQNTKDLFRADINIKRK
ncbi:unnamed protein product [Paramecium primaurelia]|uniref:Uncharacterized protein n=1 Tax=Paramecium primaurelia TaxID=5886 RepID=A0A8S1MZG6_PARPR|nr:unnamed protein product [Paramecium primaurelia]